MSYELYNGDCLEVMQKLIDNGVRVDFILTDIPYGLINNLQLSGANYKDGINWDNEIPIQPMFQLMEKILREKGIAILFSQSELTARLRTQTIHNLPYLYSYIWLKNSAGNSLMSKKAPINLYEELSVFYKEHDTAFENPLRKYAQKVEEHITKQTKRGLRASLENRFNNKRSGEHFFAPNGIQFAIPNRKAYEDWIEAWSIDKVEGFIPYDDLVKINNRYVKVFNLQQGKKTKSNVLQYQKPSGKEQGYHATQKPVALLEDLILTYTNEGDTVLDFTMGSGSTGIACLNTNRNFIGIELSEDIFKVAEQRIDNHIKGMNII